MWLRLSLICLFWAPVGTFPGYTAQSLRERYGQPVSEDFLVRPGIVASATYGKDGQVCELLIRPQRPSSLIKSADTKGIDAKSLTEVIDELVPENRRGKLVGGTFLNITCLPTNDCIGSADEWEKVVIYYNAGETNPHYATVQFKGKDCGSKASH
jgi:hypothetical protein